MNVYNNIRYLTPDTQQAVVRFANFLDSKGLSPKIGETFRTADRQRALFNQSILEKHPVTKTLDSWHEVGRAVDLDISPATTEMIPQFIAWAESFGFHSIATPENGYWDWHHIEFRGGRTYWEALAEYNALGLAPDAEKDDNGRVFFNLATIFGMYTTLYDAL